MGAVADVLGILGFLISAYTLFQVIVLREDLLSILKERNRQSKTITIVLRNGVDTITLPGNLKRSEFTRAEVLGRVGMIPRNDAGGRFSIAYLSTPKFFIELDDIANGDDDATLEIQCTDGEFNAFDLDTFNKAIS